MNNIENYERHPGSEHFMHLASYQSIDDTPNCKKGGCELIEGFLENSILELNEDNIEDRMRLLSKEIRDVVNEISNIRVTANDKIEKLLEELKQLRIENFNLSNIIMYG